MFIFVQLFNLRHFETLNGLNIASLQYLAQMSYCELMAKWIETHVLHKKEQINDVIATMFRIERTALKHIILCSSSSQRK